VFSWKSTKTQKVTKTGKCKKLKKWQNQKREKVKKWQNQNQQKSVKKVSKIDPPSKRPKCQINGQNRQFVFSEPPGPGIFEFQGVPRDPVLRPKSTPLILNGKSQHEFHHLRIFWFVHFSIFHLFAVLWNVTNWHFMMTQCLIVIRPYCNYRCRGDYTGRMMILCGGSPLILMPGRVTGEVLFILSFSPLWTGIWVALFCLVLLSVSDDGEIHRVEVYFITPVLPSFYFYFCFLLVVSVLFQMSGRLHRVVDL